MVERVSDLRFADCRTRVVSSLVERFSDKEEADSSILSRPTIGFGKASKEEVDGPTPSVPTFLVGKTMVERSCAIDLSERGWEVRRNYSTPDADSVILKMAGDNALQTFDTGPGRRSAIIYDPTKVEIVSRNLGMQARDISYAPQQLLAEDYEVVGCDISGTVYGLVSTKNKLLSLPVS